MHLLSLFMHLITVINIECSNIKLWDRVICASSGEIERADRVILERGPGGERGKLTCYIHSLSPCESERTLKRNQLEYHRQVKVSRLACLSMANPAHRELDDAT